MASQSVMDFINYKASYGVGIVIGLILYRYMEKRIFPTQKFQHSERLFWANLLLFSQMLNIAFVFIGFLIMSSNAKLIPDLIFETFALVLFGFLAFGGIDGEISLFCVNITTHSSIISYGYWFHLLWTLLHMFQFIPSYLPLFYVRACITFDAFIGYTLLIKSFSVDSTDTDYQYIK